MIICNGNKIHELGYDVTRHWIHLKWCIHLIKIQVSFVFKLSVTCLLHVINCIGRSPEKLTEDSQRTREFTDLDNSMTS